MAGWHHGPVRAAAALASVFALSGCAPREKEVRNCCAINPTATCESKVLAAGVARQELRAMQAPDGVCPAPDLAEARIREIARLIDASGCQHITGRIVLSRLDGGVCSRDAG